MDIEVYEDQTGDRLFPTAKLEKDEKIKKFFSGNVDLHIEKRRNDLTVHCHVLARKGLDRYQGYYIKCTDSYIGNYFINFKREADKALNNLGLQLSPENVEIFDNIYKFDLEGHHREDIDAIIYATNSSDYLNYNARNINDISALCNNILRKINNIKIVISSEESKLGDINILRNKKSEESLNATDNTKQVLEKYRKKKIDEKKRLEIELGKNKIKDGFVLVKEGVGIFKKAGYDPTDIIIEETNNIIGRTSVSRIRDEDDKIKKKYGNGDVKKRDEDDKIKKKHGNGDREDDGIEISVSTIAILVAIGVIIVLTISYFIYVPFVSDITGKQKPVPTTGPAPTNTSTDVENTTVVTTPTPTQTPTPVITTPMPPIILYNVTGYVKKGNQNRSNVTVILDKDGKDIDHNVTNRDGFYIFREVKNGAYNVTIQNVTIQNVTPRMVEVNGSDKTNINLTI